MKRILEHHRAHVKKWEQSGLSMKQYCREHGISYWSFRDWRKLVKSKTFQNGTGFVELPVTIKNQNKEYDPLEIILRNGLKIIAGANTDTGHIKEIVRTLESLS